MKLSRKLLEKDMKEHEGLYGQVLVLESQTGNVKAWVALQDELHDGNLSDAPLFKHQLCTDPQKAFLATMCLLHYFGSLHHRRQIPSIYLNHHRTFFHV